MFKKLKNKKLLEEFLDNVRNNRYNTREAREVLKALPIDVLRDVGKEIIYSDYDGYNSNSKYCDMIYFDNLDRWQKEFYVYERLYKLCA